MNKNMTTADAMNLPIWSIGYSFVKLTEMVFLALRLGYRHLMVVDLDNNKNVADSRGNQRA